jgi:UDP-N-acetylglucosamine--N-acetylmuramyl-(pentapeptide) pyrophosphoryl-undecaprenol N-acetylglucosamine transferase
VLLIFGGSQGARALNEAVAAWIARGLPDDVHLIWGTGKGSFDAYARHESERVRVRAYLSPIADAYAAADLALARAGAMSTAELCAWGLPTILVPLPTAAADHQTANARALAQAGAALHLPQARLDADALDRTVRELVADRDRLRRMAAAAASRARPTAAADIARRVLALARGAAALS